MADMDIYDLCIVGAGMFGSAAARHASSIPGVKVCLIGPDEPQTRPKTGNREIFGAHYDEGRITRGTESDPVWAVLTQKSIERYRDLEKSSGINFYGEVGCLVAGEKDKDFMVNIKDNAAKQNVDLVYLKDMQQIKNKFPFYNFNERDEAVYEEKNSGYVSPRNLIRAQHTVAKRNDCHIVRDVVLDVTRCVDGNGEYIMEVSTENGRRLQAKKVLFTTGAFVNLRKLLGSYMTCNIKLCPITVAKVEVSEQDARKISEMPSTVYYGFGGKGWCKDFPKGPSGNTWFYMLPPIKYPDGKYYLKLGHYAPDVPRELTSGQEVKDWYCSQGDDGIIKSTAKLILDVIKGVKMLSYHGDCCVITETPSNRPYIDMVHSQLGIAIGGNGHGAKSSDEVGRIAAMMVLNGSWESSIPKDAFRMQLKSPGYVSKL